MTDKNQLYYFVRIVTEEAFSAAKFRAYRQGTVLECNEFSLFAFDTAYRFTLPDGLQDGTALCEVQEKLDNTIRISISDLEKNVSMGTSPAPTNDGVGFAEEEDCLTALKIATLLAVSGKNKMFPSVNFFCFFDKK